MYGIKRDGTFHSHSLDIISASAQSLARHFFCLPERYPDSRDLYVHLYTNTGNRDRPEYLRKFHIFIDLSELDLFLFALVIQKSTVIFKICIKKKTF